MNNLSVEFDSAMVSLPEKEQWDDLNSKIKSKYFSSLNGSLRVYQSEIQALTEILIGTNVFLSHKKSVAALRGVTPYLDALNPFWIREQIPVTLWDVTELPQSLAEAQAKVAALPATTAYVFLVEDHPVTGALYPWNYLDQALNEKRILSLRLSHHSHFQETTADLRPFSVRIQVYDSTHVVAALGARVKTPPMSVSYGPWRDLKDLWLTDSWSLRSVSPSAVEKFETEMSEFSVFSNQDRQRVFDRAVLSFPGINSSRLVQALRSLNDISANQKKQILGMNLCDWDSFKLYSWWSHSLSPEQLRGLLILPVSVIVQKQIVEFLKKEYAKILQEQTWIIP